MIKKLLFVFVLFLTIHPVSFAQLNYYVSVSGNDKSDGSLMHPFRTPSFAIKRALDNRNKDVIIEIGGGTYDLTSIINITSSTYHLNSLTIRGRSGEKVQFTGKKVIDPRWKLYKGRIVVADIDLNNVPDVLFMNERVLNMARYPNYDSAARVFNGTAEDAISIEKVKQWKNPAGGYIHALHSGEWGDFHYQITGKDDNGKLVYEGGWQNNRPSEMHREHRFVENVFEELDAPGEWFYDKTKKQLYVYPPKGVEPANKVFSISMLSDLIHISGNESEYVKNISFSNIHFTQTARSFMLNKEPLLRSDWTIYRGGAILLDRTENVTINGCTFSQLGGNAVFLSNFNKNNHVTDNHIYDIGGSAIAFVGNPGAVRSPAFRYEWFVPWDEMDYSPGPKSNDYPQYCMASGNLIHHIGTIEKQVAGVQIEMASHITVRHNTIYQTPRSGINIGDGCWGGHVLEFNDVFFTVLETGDHGAFNSWGRDRFWRPERHIIDSIVAARPGIELLDVVDPIVIRNNRFQCEHGWDIDLDDGSSNYQIYNNVCLNGGLKLREGYHRIVFNNILINNTFHPHVWLKNSGDVFIHNIVTSPYAPIQMNSWGKQIDSNFFLTKEGLIKAQLLKLDHNSMTGNALFVNANAGNYQLLSTSPAYKTGFKKFEMNFGVLLPALKKIAEKPPIKALVTSFSDQKGAQLEWLGATFKNIETLGEKSAAGLHNNNGALLVHLTDNSLASNSQLMVGDVITAMDGQAINAVSDLFKIYQSIKWKGAAECTIMRNQTKQALRVIFK